MFFSLLLYVSLFSAQVCAGDGDPDGFKPRPDSAGGYFTANRRNFFRNREKNFDFFKKPIAIPITV